MYLHNSNHFNNFCKNSFVPQHWVSFVFPLHPGASILRFFLLRPVLFYLPLQPCDPNPYDPGAQRSHLWPITFSLHWHWPPTESQISVPFTSRLVPVGSQSHAVRQNKLTIRHERGKKPSPHTTYSLISVTKTESIQSNVSYVIL